MYGLDVCVRLLMGECAADSGGGRWMSPTEDAWLSQ